MTSLHGKVAIITGASSGIGRATARLFAEHGACVVLNARRADMLENVAREIHGTGGQVVAVAGDVMLEETHARLVEAALGNFGHLEWQSTTSARWGKFDLLQVLIWKAGTRSSMET